MYIDFKEHSVSHRVPGYVSQESVMVPASNCELFDNCTLSCPRSEYMKKRKSYLLCHSETTCRITFFCSKSVCMKDFPAKNCLDHNFFLPAVTVGHRNPNIPSFPISPFKEVASTKRCPIVQVPSMQILSTDQEPSIMSSLPYSARSAL